MAIYQARFNRYLEDRGMKPCHGRESVDVCDGETDEPESLGAITLARAEKLDNLDFLSSTAILQRLDGPVRGNGQIIQELESAFRGARWKRYSRFCGERVDPIFERRTPRACWSSVLANWSMANTRSWSFPPAHMFAKHFFGSDPRLLQLVEPMSDESLRRLRLGGHESAQSLCAIH